MNTNKLPILILAATLFSCLGCAKIENPSYANSTSTVDYLQSDANFTNPERGLTHSYPIKKVGLDQQKIIAERKDISMVIEVFYLDDFRTKDISNEKLVFIQDELNKIRTAGLKLVIRFAYTDVQEWADAPLSSIMRHIDQLKPIFEKNKDIIAFMQAGFIGAWGEWYYSTNGLNNIDAQRKVVYKLLSVLPKEIMVQVRTPSAKQNIFGTYLPVTDDIAYTDNYRARVGHHNDCFLSSNTDYGTYGSSTAQAEKEYLNKEGLYVPEGGETCPPDNYDPNCNRSTNEMRWLRWTYLNLDWYKPTLDLWRSSGCFDEIQRNLGYRLALTTATLPDQGVLNNQIKINISIANYGYAPLYNKKQVFMVLKNNTSGLFYSIPMNVDLRDCKPQFTLKINEVISLKGVPKGDYNCFLRIADNAENLQSKIEYAIRLANKDTWTTENGGMNSLKHELKVN